jgi:hypothetical protein
VVVCGAKVIDFRWIERIALPMKISVKYAGFEVFTAG